MMYKYGPQEKKRKKKGIDIHLHSWYAYNLFSAEHFIVIKLADSFNSTIPLSPLCWIYPRVSHLHQVTHCIWYTHTREAPSLVLDLIFIDQLKKICKPIKDGNKVLEMRRGVDGGEREMSVAFQKLLHILHEWISYIISYIQGPITERYKICLVILRTNIYLLKILHQK